MRTRLKLDLWLTLLLLAMCPLASFAVGDDLEDPLAGQSQLVEIEYAPEVLLPYRERRDEWSWVAGFNYENFYPTGYVSADQPEGFTYERLFGEEMIPLFGLQGGLKYNASFGSFSAEASFANGSLSATPGGVPTTMTITKMAGHIGLWLDMLFDEPYVVPYGQFNAAMVDYVDSVNVSGLNIEDPSSSGSVMMMGYTVGAMIQLNWLDPDAALSALVSSGMNNSYVNLFISQMTGADSDKLDTDVSWGAGVKIEF